MAEKKAEESSGPNPARLNRPTRQNLTINRSWDSENAVNIHVWVAISTYFTQQVLQYSLSQNFKFLEPGDLVFYPLLRLTSLRARLKIFEWALALNLTKEKTKEKS